MKRILIVEDDVRNLNGLSRLVERAGFRVAVSDHYHRAARLLETQPFDGLVTDLDLPGGTGLDLARLAQSYRPDMAIILVTAYGCSEVRKQARELGLAGYFEKPFDPAALIERLRSSAPRHSLGKGV